MLVNYNIIPLIVLCDLLRTSMDSSPHTLTSFIEVFQLITEIVDEDIMLHTAVITPSSMKDKSSVYPSNLP